MDLSVVVPLYNEAESLMELYKSINSNLPDGMECEIIFVDDGSTDNSYEKMMDIYNSNSNVRLLRLRKNFGKTTALSCGFSIANGDILITMDADLQDDPAEFPKLLSKFHEGYDVVTGWKQKRKDSIIRVYGSKFFNFLISKASKLELHDINCGLKLYSRDVYKKIVLYGDHHRFIPMIAHMMGYKVTEVPVRHYSRKYGESKYRAIRYQGMIDIVTIYFLYSFQGKPLHVFNFFAIPLFLVGFSIFLFLSFQHLIYILSGNLDFIIKNRPLLMLSFVLIILAVQMFLTGLLSELIVNAFYKTNRDNSHLIKEVKDI